jgi:hypothetical protein
MSMFVDCYKTGYYKSLRINDLNPKLRKNRRAQCNRAKYYLAVLKADWVAYVPSEVTNFCIGTCCCIVSSSAFSPAARRSSSSTNGI